MNMHKRVYNLWKNKAGKYFWGDLLDSRFYVAHLVSKWNDEIVVDVGCGAGILLHCTKAKLKIGLDLSLDSLKLAKKIGDPNIEVIQADSRYLPLKSEKFSKILAIHIIPALHKEVDRLKVMREIKRISNQKTEILIAGANRGSKFFEKIYSEEYNKSFTHFSEIVNFFQNDFSVIAEGYGAFSKQTMFSLRFIYKIPEKFLEKSGIEMLVFKLLKGEKQLKDGRSYVIICNRERN